MRSARALIAMLLAVAPPTIAEAQTRTQPRTPPRTQPASPQPRLGARAYVSFGSLTLTATDTFDAVADTHSRPVFGGGVQVTSIWKGVFADVGVSQLTIDGERVFVSNNQVFKLGIPLEITMRPVDLAAGWRFRFGNGRVMPYAGAGLTYLTYEETSDFAQADEDVSESKTGPLVLGGVDVQVWRWISAGGELRWRRVNGILGEGGASAAFDEDDAGGFSAGVRISIGR